MKKASRTSPRRFYPSENEFRVDPDLDGIDKEAGCVYVVEIGDSIKVGISLNPLSRIASLRAFGAIGRIYITRPSKHFRRIEALAHESLQEDRIRSEFFKTTFEVAVSIVRFHAREWGCK
jgi:hypothetical protein